jgi:hypothetical protein
MYPQTQNGASGGKACPDSGDCAWSGAADGVVVEFETWLDKKYPRPVHATA